MYKELWAFHDKAIQVCRDNYRMFPPSFVMPSYLDATDIHALNDTEKLVVIVSFVLSIGITPGGIIGEDLAQRICLGLAPPVFSRVPIEAYNSFIGHEMKVFIIEDKTRPYLYLSDHMASIRAIKAIWDLYGDLMPTFMKAPGKRDERYGIAPGKTNWYLNVVASPSEQMDHLLWLSSDSCRWHAEHTRDGVYCLTAKGPGVVKGIRHIEEAALSASNGARTDFWHGIHVIEARKIFKRVVPDGSADMVPADEVFTSVAMPSTPRPTVKEISTFIQNAVSDATQFGAAVMRADHLEGAGQDIRKLRYRVGQGIKIIKSSRKGEYWFVNRDAIVDLQRSIEDAIIMSSGGTTKIDYSKFFSGLTPPLNPSVFSGSMSGDMEMILDGSILEIFPRIEKQQPKGKSFRKDVLLAANMAILNCRPYEVECPISRIGNARTYIHMAVGSGKVKTRYEAGKLIISPA